MNSVLSASSPRLASRSNTIQPRSLSFQWPQNNWHSFQRQIVISPSLLQTRSQCFQSHTVSFFSLVGAAPLFSTSSSLFSPKQGGRGITMLPKSFSPRYSSYLHCFQQNTNSCALFSATILCFHHFMNSFRKNTRGREGYRVSPANAAPKKMRTSSKAAYPALRD